MGDRAFNRVAHLAAKDRVRLKFPDHVYGFVFEAHGPAQRDERVARFVDQGEFIGEQPPFTVYQSGAQGAFPGAGRSWHDNGSALFFHNSRVQDEILMRIPRYTPVHSPLEHRESLVQWQGLEGNSTIERKQNLGTKPAP